MKDVRGDSRTIECAIEHMKNAANRNSGSLLLATPAPAPIRSSAKKFSEAVSDYCEIKGTIRIDGQRSTIFTSKLAGNESWVIRPYAIKGSEAMKSREWTIKPVKGRDMPSCTITHSVLVVLFSTGGFSGNHFHDFSDIVIPLSSALLQKRHRWPKGLGIDTSRYRNGYSINDFRDFLRSTYSLKRRAVIKLEPINHQRPRLMIISRKSTRRLTNEARIAKMTQKIGYEVVIANVTLSTNLTSFSQVVNSCDVFMGVHGAGLTNMVFLPDNAVVVPLGEIEGFAKTDFGDPSKEMRLRYLKYSIRVKESSLATQYAADDVVLRDPMSIHKQGWDAIRTTYLVQQNVKLDVRRFRSTLLKALKLLGH
ncbi:hypothetical protein L6452_15086 [Arctium lappa]|uniref:Uncharacterized protein n=1 Tax=Arctium lappa TaxID=4217 RepID=A0ACB9CMS9_ARCLA|nr:hypothetical protein L6452_15086 [Arctium lappa]